MNEYMFFIRKKNEGTLQNDKMDEFLKACETYIKNLKQQGVLLSASPIVWDGKIISGTGEKWKESDYKESGEVIGGYYHILANDLDEAVEIAKENPEFSYNKDTRIEIRPVKNSESRTDFVYPSESV
jgi:hypothetical protein